MSGDGWLPGHEVGRDLVITDVRRRAEITQLQHEFGFVYENIVRFNICKKNTISVLFRTEPTFTAHSILQLILSC